MEKNEENIEFKTGTTTTGVEFVSKEKVANYDDAVLQRMVNTNISEGQEEDSNANARKITRGG